MKAKDVLRILGISRVTLMTYLKKKYITANKLPNGFYDYDDKSVYDFKNNYKRTNVIYSRVSTYKQKKDLKRQIENIKEFCEKNSIQYSTIYSEISPGIDLDRKEFNIMLQDIFKFKIDKVIISNKDRLTRLSFITLENIFRQFGTKIIVLSRNEKKNNSNYNELFEELIFIMHYFSTKEYSNRKNSKKHEKCIKIYKDKKT